jgi:hypothetical protein
MINGQAEVPAKPQDLNDVRIASDRNLADAEHHVAFATQDPNANEPVLIWEDVRHAVSQPKM